MPYISSFLSNEKMYIELNNNVSKVLINLFGYYSAAKSFVFNGKKISASLVLNEVEHLQDNHNIYIIQKSVSQIKEINLSEIKKYQNMLTLISSEDLEFVNFKNFFLEPENIKKIFFEHSHLKLNQIALDILSDPTLLMHYFYKQPNFFIEHNSLFLILKNYIDSILPSLNNSNMFSSSHNQLNNSFNSNSAVQSSSTLQQPAITSQMLQQALNFIGFTNQNANSTPTTFYNVREENQNSSLMDVELNYNESQHIYKNQLEQMREFGFTNDEENIRALIISDGSLEMALEMVISMRD